MLVPNSMKDKEISCFCAANMDNPDVTYNRSTETQEIMFSISFIIICMKKCIDSDWRRGVKFYRNTVPKKGNTGKQAPKHFELSFDPCWLKTCIELLCSWILLLKWVSYLFCMCFVHGSECERYRVYRGYYPGEIDIACHVIPGIYIKKEDRRSSYVFFWGLYIHKCKVWNKVNKWRKIETLSRC